MLRQLEALGVVQRRDGLYRVGAGLFRLGQAWEPYPRLLPAARRPLNLLAATTKSSAVLTVPHQGESVIAAASHVRPEDALLLRPGCGLPRGVDFVMAPVFAPTGRGIGMVGTAGGDDARAAFVGEIARAISAAVRP
ncbi:transcriptional regulator, IclR family protein [Actinokineospora sp. NPDC004072]